MLSNHNVSEALYLFLLRVPLLAFVYHLNLYHRAWEIAQRYLSEACVAAEEGAHMVNYGICVGSKSESLLQLESLN